MLTTRQGAASTARGGHEETELRARLRRGELDDVLVEIEVQEAAGGPLVSVLGGQGFEEVEGKIKEMFGNLPGMAGKYQVHDLMFPRRQVGDAFCGGRVPGGPFS